MMKFKIKRTEYLIDVDQYQYILKKKVKPKDADKGEDNYTVLGYYKDLQFLILKLVKMGGMERKKAVEIDVFIKDTLNTIKKSLQTAIDRGTFND